MWTKEATRGQSAPAPEALRTLPPLRVAGGVTWGQAVRQSARSAASSLLAHRFRALLTVLGVVIGVAGVMVISAVGQSQNAAVTAQLAQLGSNVVSVSPGLPRPGGAGGAPPTLTAGDAQAIGSQAPDVAAVTPEISGSAQTVAGSLNWGTTVQGAYPELASIQNDQTRLGAFYTTSDETAARTVAVLGQTVVDHLFPNVNPIGQQIRIRNVDFRVVGVLTAKGHDASGDLDDVVIVPFSTAQQRLFGFGPVATILLQVDQTDHIPLVIQAVTAILERTHHITAGGPNDFAVRSYQQLVDSARQQTALLSRVLTAVAAVALAVGGLGIMNVMLISVSERTSEIGVRLAIGAQPGDVLLQFIAEALTVSLLGAITGVVAGYAAALGLPHAIRALAQYPALPAPPSAGIAVALSVAVGVIFGLYPAYRASRLDPISALRSE